VVLCVKPADVPGALFEIRDALAGKLLVSIVAGLSSSVLAELCGPNVRIVRTMPNTAALVGQSATACCAGPGATAEDLKTVLQIFGGVGLSVEVPEKLLDAVTGLSGSGPAYIFLIIESLAEAGVHAGLSRTLANQLATQTVLGAATLASETGEHPAILREAVTSPGGTTAAGLAVLEAAAIRSAMIEAVSAAAEKACELGR
jgi:pyrroline-5-carboxylate reductase